MRTLGLVVVLLIGACGKGDGKGGGKDDPGLLDYAKKSKKTEGELQLEHLASASKRYYLSHDSSFPKIKVGPTPAMPCCEQPTHRCEANASDWMGTDWDQLDFKMIDGQFYFQYSYESDGKTFTATATGDLDCDPTSVSTYVAHGRVVDGEPTVQIEQTSTEN